MRMLASLPRRRGFTLIEVMVTVAIVGLLAAIALPNYQRYVTDSRRRAAAACLLESAQFMERFYTTNLRYDQDAAGNNVALPNTTCQNDLVDFYAFTIDAVAPRTYTLVATAKGVQATRDTKCGNLSVNQAGVKSISGAGTLAECW